MLKDANEQPLADAKSLCEKQGVEVETIDVEGDACEEILRAAQERKAGLICIGTHGCKGFSRLFLGSFCEGVLRRSSVPVLATRPSKTQTAQDTEHRAAAQAAN
jgi:nucleotide-binding universal stress UspA family protein